MKEGDVPPSGKRGPGEKGMTAGKRRARGNIGEVKSKAFQVPLAGSRVCIRTWLQANGWEGKGLMMISQGLVPK